MSECALLLSPDPAHTRTATQPNPARECSDVTWKRRKKGILAWLRTVGVL